MEIFWWWIGGIVLNGKTENLKSIYFFEPTNEKPILNIVFGDVISYGWFPFLLNIADSLYYIPATPKSATESILGIDPKQISLGSNTKIRYIGQVREKETLRIKIEGYDRNPYPIAIIPLRPAKIIGNYLE